MAASSQARRRRTPARGLAWLAVFFAVVALVLSYVGRAVLRTQPFADRAVATLRDQAVRDDVADHLTSALVNSGGGDLIAVRPVVRALTGAIINTGAFSALFRRAVLDAHAAAVHRHGGAIFVNVADAGVLIEGALQRFSPGAARTVGAERVSRLLTIHPGGAVLVIVRIANNIYRAAWIAGVLAALVAAIAVWLSDDRRRTVHTLGLGLMAGGLAVVALYLVGAAVVQGLAPSGRGAVAGAVWRSFLGGLRTQALWMAAGGVVVAAVATTGPGTEDWRERWRRLVVSDAVPVKVGLARSIAVIAAGAAIVLEPSAALTLAATLVGLYLLYSGIQAALSWTGRALAARSRDPQAQERRTRGLGTPARAAVAVAAIVAVTVVIAAGGGDEAPAATPLTCNGFVALCARPLNDVAFAATHNSMASVTIPTWTFGQQDGTIADQLGYGIRGLLIDTYYGESIGGRVRTDLASVPKRDVAVQQIGEPAVAAAERLRSRIGPHGSGSRGIYLCHTFCEFGAVSFPSALADIRSFLVSNPGEVLIVVIQDEGVTPADTERAFGDAGLLDLVYRGPLGPFPTLREMIDSNQRLVVMAENDAGTVPWYHLAYDHALQETPFTFRSAAALTDQAQLQPSCRANRGPDTAPLLLLNHWVDTSPVPRASLAEVVNQRGPLLRRAQTCERLRHRLPNLVAVDFYRRGDVLGVVNALNGVG
ncbi:MAG TPA: hypothetical protein VGF93_09210 [Solirubrobacteraceae bacterium]